ncbi:MAG: hypothetical protein H0X46_00060 [Bacteroidetes bacterium]|nr:hypothetical protein [Bacteroidota bacterium]
MNNIRYYSNFVMIAVYLGLGLLFFFTEIAINTFPNYRKELGITMMVYAVIRTIMIIRKHNREKEDGF